MKKLLVLSTLLFSIIGISSCKRNTDIISSPDTEQPVMKLPHIVANGNKLFTSEGKPFRAWGFNFGNGLLEDQWKSDWNGLVSDFKEMKGYGANTVRIALQYSEMMKDAQQADPVALMNLKRLVKVAEENQLYLVVCGLNAFVKDRQPAWYNAMNDAERWRTQAIFWEAVAGAIGNSPAVLCYDLMNEPVVAVNPENGWLPGNEFGGYYFVQNIALQLNGQTIEMIMRNWIAQMTAAIRKKDNQHLITVGFLPFVGSSRYASSLPMMSTHIYPHANKVNESATTVDAFVSDKPLLISEVFNLFCSEVEVQQLIERKNNVVCGWLWHYNGYTLEELEKSAQAGNIANAIYRAALLKFIEMADKQK